jgi:hypothetical protein
MNQQAATTGKRLVTVLAGSRTGRCAGSALQRQGWSSADPAGLRARARPEARPETRATNLHGVVPIRKTRQTRTASAVHSHEGEMYRNDNIYQVLAAHNILR